MQAVIRLAAAAANVDRFDGADQALVEKATAGFGIAKTIFGRVEPLINLLRALPILREQKSICAPGERGDLLQGLLQRVMLGRDDDQIETLRRGDGLAGADGIDFLDVFGMVRPAVDDIHGHAVGELGGAAGTNEMGHFVPAPGQCPAENGTDHTGADDEYFHAAFFYICFNEPFLNQLLSGSGGTFWCRCCFR